MLIVKMCGRCLVWFLILTIIFVQIAIGVLFVYDAYKLDKNVTNYDDH